MSEQIPWPNFYLQQAPIFLDARIPHALFAEDPLWPSLDKYTEKAQKLEIMNAQGQTLTFVPDRPKRAKRRRRFSRASKEECERPLHYDQRIFERAEVPTRTQNWHDYFNMLSWFLYPLSKSALNARQVRLTKERQNNPSLHPQGNRTPQQDTMTILDEAGILMPCLAEHRIPLERLLRTGKFGSPDQLCADLAGQDGCEFFIFGHAVHEAFLGDVGSIGGLVIPVEIDRTTLQGPRSALRRDLDLRLARMIDTPALMGRASAYPSMTLKTLDRWRQQFGVFTL